MSKEYWKKYRKFKKIAYKSEEQKETIANINRILNARENVIQMIDDFTTIAFEAKNKAIKGKGIKS